MRWVWRGGLLAILAVQAAVAVRVSVYDARFHEAKRLYAADRYDDALKEFLRARAVRDGDPLVWAWIGDAADGAYRFPKSGALTREQTERLMTLAWEGYAGSVLRSSVDTWSWCGLADAALRRASDVDATAGVDLAQLERRSQGQLDAWRAAALVAARIAVELKPSGFQEQDALTRVYESAGRVDEAKELVIRSARMMPDPAFHRWGEGQRLVKPLYGAIMTAMREGVAKTPAFERSTLHRDIARFALAQGDLEGALDHMEQAVKTAPDVDALYLALRGQAEALDALGRFDQAVTVWDSVIDTGVSAPVDRRERGLALHRAGRDKDACRDLRESVRDDPKDRDLRILASSVCEAGGERDTSEHLLKSGFVLPIDDPTLARALLDLYMRHGKRSSVDGLLRKWARDYPENEEFRRWAAALLAESR